MQANTGVSAHLSKVKIMIHTHTHTQNLEIKQLYEWLCNKVANWGSLRTNTVKLSACMCEGVHSL